MDRETQEPRAGVGTALEFRAGKHDTLSARKWHLRTCTRGVKLGSGLNKVLGAGGVGKGAAG